MGSAVDNCDSGHTVLVAICSPRLISGPGQMASLSAATVPPPSGWPTEWTTGVLSACLMDTMCLHAALLCNDWKLV